MVTKNVTTITLSGETAVQFNQTYNYFWITNLGDDDVFASMDSGITEGADGVIIIPSGSSASTMHGYNADTVYLSGNGKVQVMGTFSAFSPFKAAKKGGEFKTASGDDNYTLKTAEFPLLNLNVYGRSWQGYASHGGKPLGKNLFDCSLIPTATYNGVTFTNNNDGTFTISGTKTDISKQAVTSVVLNHEDTLKIIQSSGTYTISGVPGEYGSSLRAYINVYSNGTMRYNAIVTHKNNGVGEITKEEFEASDFYIHIGFYSQPDYEIIAGTFYIQIEKGDTATEFEPYKGTPNPDCPVPIENIGDSGSVTVTTSGKNLFENLLVGTTQVINGITFAVNDDGTITANGTSTDTATFNLKVAEVMDRFAGKDVILSGCPEGGGTWDTYYVQTYTDGWENGIYDYGDGAVFSPWEPDRTIIRIAIGPNVTLNNLVFNPMIRPASVSDDTYEPYKSTTAAITTGLPLRGIPVSSGGNYTDSSGQEWICDTIEHVYTSAVIKRRIAVIDNYNGESIEKNYISTTEELTNGATVIYPLETPVETTLSTEEIQALNTLQTFDEITNVYNSGNANMSVKYCASKKVSEAVLPIINHLKGDT